MVDVVARPVTSGPTHHFFGYFGIQPWNLTEEFLLSLEVPFQDRPPQPDDAATVGMVDLSTLKFMRLAETRAWNFQQGAMMHWMPGGSEIIYNDRQGSRLISVVLDVRTGKRRIVPRPISAVSHDGRTALSLNFGRLQWARPGYGYAGASDPYAKDKHPEDDGVYLLDLESGENWRVISLDDIADLEENDEMRGHAVFFNHTSYNTDDSRFAFLIQWDCFWLPRWARIWKLKKLGELKAKIFTASIDGSGLCGFVDFEDISHFDWRNPRELLMWARSRLGEHFYLAKDEKNEFRIIGEKCLTRDGHCSFSPNRRWILTDTYPDKNRLSTLKVFNCEDGHELILGRFYSHPSYSGEIRCDLHPRWSRTGSKICFDSVHEGSRQMYVMDVRQLTEEGDPRHVL